MHNHDGEVQDGAFYLPPEILCEILSRLPIESILRCRSVCKKWNLLPQDPYFINLQLNRTNNQIPRSILKSNKVGLNNLLLLDTERCYIRKIPFKKMQLPSYSKFMLQNLQLMCSCNGLLCLASPSRQDPLIIVNPILRESVILPPAGRIKDLASQIGFHFDPSSGRYKVVRAYRNIDDRERSKFEMITLGESSWRELSAPCVPLELHCRGAVYWNGAFHWKIDDKDNRSGFNSILSFDIGDEKFYTISCHCKFGRAYDLTVLEGCLTLIERDAHLMKIWKVTGTKDDGFSLCFQRKLDTNVIWNHNLHYAVISQNNDDDFLLQGSFGDGNGHRNDWFVQFSPKKQPMYNCLNIPGLPNHIQFQRVSFKPTFVSPKAALLGL